MIETKQEYLIKLMLIAFEIEKKVAKRKQKVEEIQKLASLERKGQKDSEEYKILERKYKNPTVTDFGNEINDLCQIVKQLKKYK